MLRIFVINGPNINLLGIREPKIYGTRTYDDLIKLVLAEAKKLEVEVKFVQSNHEGGIIDALQEAAVFADGIILNPAAYTHTSIAIADTLRAIAVPTVEVHITDPCKRETYRHISYIRPCCIASIRGKGLEGYVEALNILMGDDIPRRR